MRCNTTPLVRALSAVALACAAWAAPHAQAALFSDDEARRAILELRSKVDANAQAGAGESAKLFEEIAQLRRGLLELQTQIDTLKSEQANLRGQNEQLQRDLAEMQRRQKDMAQGVEERLRQFEPVKVTVDGREFSADPAEKLRDKADAGLCRRDMAARLRQR